MKPARGESYKHPLMARFARRREVARLWCKTEEGYISLRIGPGYSAHLTKKTRDQTREVTVSNARDCCAFVTSDLVVKGDDVERKVVTSYVTKTTREDLLKVRGTKVTRSTRWAYPGQLEAIATYSEAGRELRWFELGRQVGGVITKAKRTAGGWESSNRVMDGPGPTPPSKQGPIIRSLGTSVVQVEASTVGGDTSYGISIAGVGETGGISMIVGSLEHVRPHLDEHRVVVSIAATNPANDAERFVQNVISNQGGTTVTTTQTSQHGDGSSERTHGLAQAAGDGSFSTLTDFEKDGHLVQRSSYVNDGKGNQSETTVTFEKDGSFTIETISTDAAGNKSGSAQRFDKDGNPIGDEINLGDGAAPGGPQPSDTGRGDGAGPAGGDGGASPGGGDGGAGPGGGDGGAGPGGGDDGGAGPGSGDDGGAGPGDGDGGGGPGDGDGGGGDDGGKGMPTDDGSPSSGGRRPGRNGPLGEFPSDDGSDPTPTPFSSDPGAGSMEKWLAGLTPFYGGLISRFGGSHINPATSIVDSIDGGDGGDRAPAAEQPGDGASPAFDLRPLIRHENDPENDPRALVNALAALAGLPVNGSGMRAAANLAAYIIKG